MEHLKELMAEYHQYAYLILFIWCIIEGEIALILAGLMAHQGHISLPIAILCSATGGFIGDQINFFIGKGNKALISKRSKGESKKIKLVRNAFKVYGWPVVFIQRFLYGLRTLACLTIGLIGYDAKKFIIVDAISALIWASFYILLTAYLGERVFDVLDMVTKNWYAGAVLAAILVLMMILYLYKANYIKAVIVDRLRELEKLESEEEKNNF